MKGAARLYAAPDTGSTVIQPLTRRAGKSSPSQRRAVDNCAGPKMKSSEKLWRPNHTRLGRIAPEGSLAALTVVLGKASA